MKRNNILILLLLAVLAVSCNKEPYEAPKSKTQAMAGRWYVELYADPALTGVPDPNDLIFAYSDFGHYGFVTSNTSNDDADSVLIDFPKFNGLVFRAIVPVDINALTFKPAPTQLNIEKSYLGSGETVNIVEGKILKGAATMPSGRKADSIYLALEFSDDLGNRYILTGHRDSGQPEDQHH